MSKPPLILLVDDETHILHVLSVKLRSAGFRVIATTDGSEAIRAAIDQTHARIDASVAGAKEIAFFPPVTGG